MPRTIEFIVPPEYDGKKALSFLRTRCGVSSRLVGKLKRTENGMMMNGQRIRTIDRLVAGATVSITVPDDGESPEPISAPIDIIYEDSDLLIINKSPFMAMHPTHNHQGDTLANAVAAYLLQKGENSAFRAVGRLDKGTSGTVVCAKNKFSASNLSGKVKKTYYAIVEGELHGEGTVDVPIYRPDPMKTLRACSYEKGVESAVTHWSTVENYSGATLVKLSLETGRTHQIRVHMAFIGHPLAGDNMYGDFVQEAGHQMLHCRKCMFIHPVTNEEVCFEAEFPQDFMNLIKIYRDADK